MYGSTLTVQVADSPGADLPHRSVPEVSLGLGDTHWGGLTRSSEDSLLNGEVLGIRGLISYERERPENFWERFLERPLMLIWQIVRKQENPPNSRFKGSFSVRIPATLHQGAAILAMEAKTFLNNFVAEAIRYRVDKEPA